MWSRSSQYSTVQGMVKGVVEPCKLQNKLSRNCFPLPTPVSFARSIEESVCFTPRGSCIFFAYRWLPRDRRRQEEAPQVGWRREEARRCATKGGVWVR